jgi:hypothetical protein
MKFSKIVFNFPHAGTQQPFLNYWNGWLLFISIWLVVRRLLTTYVHQVPV